jgi:hypothetical protein
MSAWRRVANLVPVLAATAVAGALVLGAVGRVQDAADRAQ